MNHTDWGAACAQAAFQAILMMCVWQTLAVIKWLHLHVFSCFQALVQLQIRSAQVLGCPRVSARRHRHRHCTDALLGYWCLVGQCLCSWSLLRSWLAGPALISGYVFNINPQPGSEGTSAIMACNGTLISSGGIWPEQTDLRNVAKPCWCCHGTTQAHTKRAPTSAQVPSLIPLPALTMHIDRVQREGLSAAEAQLPGWQGWCKHAISGQHRGGLVLYLDQQGGRSAVRARSFCIYTCNNGKLRSCATCPPAWASLWCGRCKHRPKPEWVQLSCSRHWARLQQEQHRSYASTRNARTARRYAPGQPTNPPTDWCLRTFKQGISTMSISLCACAWITAHPQVVWCPLKLTWQAQQSWLDCFGQRHNGGAGCGVASAFMGHELWHTTGGSTWGMQAGGAPAKWGGIRGSHGQNQASSFVFSWCAPGHSMASAGMCTCKPTRLPWGEKPGTDNVCKRQCIAARKLRLHCAKQSHLKVKVRTKAALNLLGDSNNTPLFWGTSMLLQCTFTKKITRGCIPGTGTLQAWQARAGDHW